MEELLENVLEDGEGEFTIGCSISTNLPVRGSQV
jgi:hypothetical protein